ncbi:hypothetical protein BO78DRAFT_31446 [Aspergillus sclerotiicarbonarius CBS 121057]|uniref:Uncharacterized protein n=1 Tax=Aspergillus sclerotiicarbonarius (strain CBS 121057 / IBT 28362) TaxID=1448318 RepID=A0A319F2N8_ASPSB|nr:hypothetical protein BO78DRAFT_31446 [Aspergillus sclerotiicarbonarius CBS 121057]
MTLKSSSNPLSLARDSTASAIVLTACCAAISWIPSLGYAQANTHPTLYWNTLLITFPSFYIWYLHAEKEKEGKGWEGRLTTLITLIMASASLSSCVVRSWMYRCC